jgi:site-specific DNA-methyltransferase (cytosine-N4-specific)
MERVSNATLPLFNSGATTAREAELPIPELTPEEIEQLVDIRRGDAYDLVQTLPEHSIDLLITSPPYWGLRAYDQDHNWDILEEWKKLDKDPIEPPPYDWYRKHGGILGLEPYPEWYVSNLTEILSHATKFLKPRGSMWVNIGDTYFARWASIRQKGRQGLGDTGRDRRRTPSGGYRLDKQLLMIPARFAIAMQGRRWILRNDLIWHKPNIPPRPETDRLRMAHEHFYHFVKRPKEGRASYYYDIEAVEPAGTDVVTYNVRPGQDGHSATFPEELIRPRILSSCPKGGVMLDPFCGTGRSLAVSITHERRAVGFDISAHYVEVSKKTVLSAHRRNGNKKEDR